MRNIILESSLAGDDFLSNRKLLVCSEKILSHMATAWENLLVKFS